MYIKYYDDADYIAWYRFSEIPAQGLWASHYLCIGLDISKKQDFWKRRHFVEVGYKAILSYVEYVTDLRSFESLQYKVY